MQKRLVMLIVDDVEVNRASMSAMFVDEYNVIMAENGEEAMRILHQKKVDVVILDIFMPVLDGAGVLEQMRADSKLCNIPVIVKTAIDENMELTMLQKGADDFIFSPCEPAIVKNRVRNIVEKYVFCQAMLKKQIKDEQHFTRVYENLITCVVSGMKQNMEFIQKECMFEENSVWNYQERLNEIHAYASQLMMILEDVLNYIKLERNEQLPHKSLFQLHDVVTELAEEYRTVCKKKAIHLVMEDCDICCDQLFGDGKYLKQVWRYILQKVVENTPLGGSIRTGCQQYETGNEQIELKIEVHGSINLNPEYPLVKSMIELLEGTMIVEEKENEFLYIIILPFETRKEKNLNQKKFGDIRVLIVDDNELTRQYHAMILTRLGIAYDMAASGGDAIYLLRRACVSKRAYDVCFFNWYMHGAKNTIREIRNMTIQEPIHIVCSTNEREKVAEEMRKEGVDYIAKRPVDQSEIYRFLTGICKESKTE